MEIEMPRPEILSAVRGDRHRVGKHAVLVVEDFERAGVFGLRRRAFVAARDQNGEPVVRRDAHLMREDAGVDGTRLLHLLAGREVVVDAIHAQRARMLVATRMFSDGMSVHMWIGRVGSRIASPCFVSAPLTGSMRNAVKW